MILLHPDLRIRPDGDWRNSDEHVQQFLSAYPFAPKDYIDIIQQNGRFFIEYPLQEGGARSYLFDALPDVLEMPDIYPWLKNMGECFFFGNDGDIVLYYSVNPKYLPGLYKVELSGASWSEASFVATSFTDLFLNGTGIIKSDWAPVTPVA